MANETVAHTGALEGNNLLGGKLRQLHALLYVTHAQSYDPFDGAESVRESFMWACGDLANDCIELHDRIAKSMWPAPTAQ